MARSLILYETYSRQDVHDIFEPGTRFTPQAGTWGLWGIVPVPGRAGDFVFFVTFGKEQAGHHFDEWVSQNGIINWQSQPRQSLADRQIQQFIHHDPAKNNIYLFLRTEKTRLYTYLGRLAYYTHDPTRERPVYIQWQILDWNPLPERLQAIGLTLRSEEPQLAPQIAHNASFEWRGVQYPVDLEQLHTKIQQQIQDGLPAEALRFRDWYVEIDGQRLSAKWIFHLITGADYSEFDAPTARDKLEKIGIQSYPVQQMAETPQALDVNNSNQDTSAHTKTAPVETQPEQSQAPAKIVQFTWRGTTYRYEEEKHLNSLKKRIQEGLPQNAKRFNKWYLPVAGEIISPNWIFHKLTKTDFTDFNTQQAREKVSNLGLPIFCQASIEDIRKGYSVQITDIDTAIEDLRQKDKDLIQTFNQHLNESLRFGTLYLPKTQNRVEAIYHLAEPGKCILRQNRQGAIELSFELPSDQMRINHANDLIQGIIQVAEEKLEYPLFSGEFNKKTFRICSEIIDIEIPDYWEFLGNEELLLKGKNVPPRWSGFYHKIKQSRPNDWIIEYDLLLGMIFAELTNVMIPLIQKAFILQSIPHVQDETVLPESKMVKKKYLKWATLENLIALMLELAQVGEISPESLSENGLDHSTLYQLISSGWALPTPYALVAAPHLLNLLPIPDEDTLGDLLNLPRWDNQNWASFDERAYSIKVENRYPQLGIDYIYHLRSATVYQDVVWRPAWLVNYMPDSDWDDWEVGTLLHGPVSRREAKCYVHSTIPVQNIYGGIPEAQDAAWKTAFYWLALQLMILSDPQTGALYDPPIQVSLSNDWRDNSIARLYLQGEYIGDLVDCLEALMACFHWVWVNRSGNTAQDQQSVLGLLRLLLKIDIAELGKDGRLQFTDDYRRKLFESQQKAQLAYRGSIDARDQLREAIKEMSR